MSFVEDTMALLNRALYQACVTISQEMHQDLVDRISEPGGRSHHSQPGDYPFTVDGDLIQGIRVSVTPGEDFVVIRLSSTAPHTFVLEYGSKRRNIAARPFMGPFFDDWTQYFPERLDQELQAIFARAA